MTRKVQHLRRTAVVLAGLAIIAGSFVPEGSVELDISDKLLHFLAYAGWSLLAALSPQHTVRIALYLSLIIMTGIAIEAIQPYVGREGSLYDIAANLGGVLAGSLLGRRLAYHFSQTS